MEETEAPIPDRLDPARAAVLWTLLGCDGSPPNAGDPLPMLFHQIYFWDASARTGFAPDGLAKPGGLIPDLGLPIRMAAGGRVRQHAPLKFGIAAEKQTSLASITEKAGRSGKLAFVTLRHEIRQRGGLVLTEEQDIVLRAAQDVNERSATRETKDVLARKATSRRMLRFSQIDLFRFSALTMNGHRIHYDPAYAASEGHGGLLVHGPFLAVWLANVAQQTHGPLSMFEYRATSPLLVDQDAILGSNGRDLWVEKPDGTVVMTARSS